MTAASYGSCSMARPADCDVSFPTTIRERWQPLRVSPYCARILLSVLRTLVHGAFPWLQPRSPVVHVVVGSAPDRPDAVAVVLESVRAAGAPVARAALRAHAVRVSRHRVVAAVAHASPRGNRVAGRQGGRVAAARAVGKAALARAADGKEAVAHAAAPSHR